jgi:hypothetical protein
MPITAFQWEDGPNHTQRVHPLGDRNDQNSKRNGCSGWLARWRAPDLSIAQLEETAARRAACMGDALMLCSSAIPNKARIATCLASKMDQLTPRCRAQFAKR